jgi:DNA-binding beta-propeller fold protein YncE
LKIARRGSVSMIKILMVLAAFMVSLPLMAGVSQAAGPEWVPGFPKLAQKNALLQWNPVKGATEYKVYKGEQKGKGKLVTTVKVNRYIDKDIPAGKTFYYSVSAVVGGSEGARSAEAAVKTEAAKVFVPLKVPRLEPGHVKDLPDGKTTVGLRWEDAGGTDLVGVNVYRSKVKGRDYALIGSSGSDMFEDKDIQRGETYYYVVTSVDSQFNETKYSNEVSINVPAPVAAAKQVSPAAAAKEEKAKPTKMRRAKLLFRMPGDNARRRDEVYVPNNPQYVAVDEAVGHIYVTSYGYGGVIVYNMDGDPQFGIRRDGVNGNKKYNAPEGVAVGQRGDVYVANFDGPDINVYDFSGRLIKTFLVDESNMPKARGKIARNYGLTIDSEGRIYVADPVGNGIHVYDADMNPLYEISGVFNEEEKKREPGKAIFNGPSSLTVAKNGDLVFTDTGYSKLMVYDRHGKFKRSIGTPGSNAGELLYPTGLATGKDGEIFSASGMSPNIQAFSIDGKFLYALCNEKADGPLDVNSVRGICIDSANRLYVTDGNMNRVSVFQILDGLVDVVPPK